MGHRFVHLQATEREADFQWVKWEAKRKATISAAQMNVSGPKYKGIHKRYMGFIKGIWRVCGGYMEGIYGNMWGRLGCNTAICTNHCNVGANLKPPTPPPCVPSPICPSWTHQTKTPLLGSVCFEATPFLYPFCFCGTVWPRRSRAPAL